jgi:predicted O-methyltransferase YrrM
MQPSVHPQVTADPDWSQHVDFLVRVFGVVQPKTGLELGVNCGISLRLFADLTPGCQWTGIDAWQNQWHWTDMPERETNARQLADGQAISLVKGYFQPEVERLGRKWDVIHVDGNHDWWSVASDFRLAWQHVQPGGVVLLHDICFQAVDVPWFWSTLKRAGYRTEENASACGLGVVYA